MFDWLLRIANKFAPMKNRSVLVATLALCVSAHGAVYTLTSPYDNANMVQGDPNGTIAHGDPNWVSQQFVSGEIAAIQNVILTLNFADTAALNGNIQGYLYLGTTASPDFISLTPNDQTYMISFDDFYNKNANTTWTLSLGNTDSTFDNQLLSWSLDITPVPEPVTFALGTFAALVVSSTVGSWLRRRTAVYLPEETEEAG
jgi:hypothetical protein